MDTEPLVLTAGAASLTLDRSGRLTNLRHGDREWLAATAPPQPLVELTLQAPSTHSVLGAHRTAFPAGEPRVTREGATWRLHYAKVALDEHAVDIALHVTITAANDEFAFTFETTNRTGNWTVRELRGPLVLANLPPPPQRPALLWPMGAGERVADPAKFGAQCQAYPSRLIMPWMALDAGGAGLYLASHDRSLATIMLDADATLAPDALALSLRVFPFCEPGGSWTSAPIVLRPHAGTWHAAADRYRQWIDSWLAPVPRSAAVQSISGWQLAILKQQDGEIIWPYTDLDRLVALGRENGLNVLGLYGWTEGGHDRQYPHYRPDEAMGGEAGLRAAIQRAQAAGMRVVLYTNGQNLDLQTDWYAKHGPAIVAVSERGEAFGEAWQKFHDAPHKPMAYACQSTQAWSDMLLSFARQVHALGADGIIFDQLGSAKPMFCFSRTHGHAHPALATGPGVAATIARVRREMQALNPEFLVMVEHVADVVNWHVDLTHGAYAGFFPGDSAFPEMLRYTFPELAATQRHPTPILDRRTANWASLYGWRHEVEYRYAPDRRCVDAGVAPRTADYGRVCERPNVAALLRLEPREQAAYLRQVLAFETRHAALLRGGRFRDTLGFRVDNPAVRAKAYATEEALGVMVWNPTDTAQRVGVTAGGAESITVDAPGEGAVDAHAPMPPDSLRLWIFRQIPA